MIGWDSLVTLEFSDRATLGLIKALAVERLTVRQATEKANLASGTDPVYKSQLTVSTIAWRLRHLQAAEGDGNRSLFRTVHWLRTTDSLE